MLMAGRKCRFLKVYDHRFIADRAAICTDPARPSKICVKLSVTPIVKQSVF